MKEIDFLPEWYKSSKRRKVNYRVQFIIAGGVFAVLMSWSFAASYTNSIVAGHVQIMQDALDSNRNISAKYEHYNKVLALLKERAGRLEKLDPKISLTGILGELSYISTDNIMLTDFDLRSETVTKEASGIKAGSVRLTSSQQGNRKIAMPADQVRYKLTLHGVALGAESVTDFISEVEKSPYFCLVVPGLLEHKEESESTRFEISCYIANYAMNNEQS